MTPISGFVSCAGLSSAVLQVVVWYVNRIIPYAFGSALAVPGLKEDELHEFLEICCKEFEVPLPSGDFIPLIQQETASLPLLVETVVGIRRFASNYQQALQIFRDKGGDEARRYLYQREYDRLSQSGRSRYVLATLLLLEDPISSQNLANFTQYSPDVVAEALSETSSIFLSAFEGSNGETVFQLTPPAVGFVKQVSENLAFFNTLRKKVGHLKREGAKDNPKDAALIVSLKSLLIQKKPERAASLIEQYPKDDPVLVNPKINALYGQALSEMGASRREDARMAFRTAESMSFRDTYMMRAWYNLEFNSGYSIPEAKRICQSCVADSRFGPRDKTEFLSKLGACQYQEAISISSVSREKALTLLRSSIVSYMEALWIGQNIRTIDISQNVSWCERPFIRLVQIAAYEIEEFLQLMEDLTDQGHDLQQEGARLLMHYLDQMPKDDSVNNKNRTKGFCIRTSNKIAKSFRPIASYPGFQQIVEAIDSVRSWAENRSKP